MPGIDDAGIEVGGIDKRGFDSVALWNQDAVRREKTASGVFGGGDGVIVKGQSAANVGDNDVSALGKLELARIGLEEFDTVGEAVACGKFAGEVDDVGGVDGEDAAGSGAAGEEREEGWAAADFKDDVAWLDGSCDRLGIGVEASGVGEHGIRPAAGL